MEPLVGPALRPPADAAEVLERHLDADAATAGEREHGLDELGLLFVVLAGADVLDVPERIAEPRADVVPSVGGELVEPCFIRAQSGTGLTARRRDEVQADGDVRRSIAQLEVTAVARADA